MGKAASDQCYFSPVLPHRDGINIPWLLADPAGPSWRQLGIKPQRHPVNTGWSISWAA